MNYFLTIAIPFYNGIDTISNILENLFTLGNEEYEILIIDDCSLKNHTDDLIKLIFNRFRNGNIRYIHNDENIGMDLNFEKCILNSNSEYVWFFGQDDIVSKENLKYCINLLKNYNPEIVFANYYINQSWNYKSTRIFHKNLNIINGSGITDFLKISNNKLPSFLPSLILKKNIWPESKFLQIFYGTHFIQLAVFLINIAQNKNWLFIGKPLAVGVIPSNGWQISLKNRYKYYYGFLSCLNKVHLIYSIELENLIHEQYKNSLLQHIFLTVESKIEKNNKIFLDLSYNKIYPFRNRLISRIIILIPNYFIFIIQFFRIRYYKFRNYFYGN
jgi:hypothetical protein